MKHLSYWLLCLFIGALSACSDDFLEVKPDDAVPIDSVLSTPQQAQEFLNGAYDALRNKGFMGGNAWILSDMMADNIQGYNLGGDWLAHYTWTTDIFLGTTRDLLFNGSKTISRGNFLLKNLDNIDGLSDADKTRMRGEVLFLRGLSMFELVRFFGQPYGYTADNSHPGIAIRTEYSRDTLNRSSVGDVYAQAIADLSEAANTLPTENGVFATSWAAKAYLAKVYFQMNDFAKAYQYADEVINGSGATLETDLTNRFGEGKSNETIFELVSTDLGNNSGGGLRDYYWIGPGATIAAAQLSQDIYGLATADPNDLRGQLWYKPIEGGAALLTQCTKFGYTTAINVPLAHLSELKLIRAEAAAELQNPIALQDLNDLRIRAGVQPIGNGTSFSDLITLIRAERRLELVAEGNRLHDLKRQAVRDLPNLKIRGIAPWDCPGMVCQLPDNELRGNPNMDPNPAGGCY